MPKAIIAEDESLLRAELVSLLRGAWPELEIAAECEDGAAALDAIEAHAPDVAFLDIRMPGLSGLDVARAASAAAPVSPDSIRDFRRETVAARRSGAMGFSR